MSDRISVSVPKWWIQRAGNTNFERHCSDLLSNLSKKLHTGL